jgi:cytochrome c oxidase assembly factor 1
MERRANRQLPPLPSKKKFLLSIPVFLAVLGASAAGLFNYQRSSSSVITSTLYALRTNPAAREMLGNEIAFASSMPWIYGTLDLLHGRIDVSWYVKGTKAQGLVKLKCQREGGRGGIFVTEEWSLTPDGGEKIHLLDEQEDPAALARGDVTMKSAR